LAQVSTNQADTVRAAYAAFNRRDDEALMALVTRDFVADLSRSIGPERGVYEGAEEFRRLLAAYWDGFESFEIEPLAITDLGDAGVVARTHGRGVGRTSGVHVDGHGGQHWEFDGTRISRWTLYQSEEDALAGARGAA
jgi:ketosteroid isomerase-like protein